MTPDLLALSRAIGKLPGAPAPQSVRGTRDRAGMAWVLLPHGDDGRLAWHIDLDDAATGGVMLARAGVDVWVIHDEDGYSLLHRGDRVVEDQPTLAAALAHFFNTRGSWNV